MPTELVIYDESAIPDRLCDVTVTMPLDTWLKTVALQRARVISTEPRLNPLIRVGQRVPSNERIREGARTRYVIDPKVFQCNIGRIDIDILHCEKKRNSVTGALLGFEVPAVDPAFPAIIIDDICDGGGTFVGIADKVGRAPLGMYITHGIFSQGFDALRERFEHIYTTNSLKKSESAPAGLVTVFDCLPEMMKESA